MVNEREALEKIRSGVATLRSLGSESSAKVEALISELLREHEQELRREAQYQVERSNLVGRSIGEPLHPASDEAFPPDPLVRTERLNCPQCGRIVYAATGMREDGYRSARMLLLGEGEQPWEYIYCRCGWKTGLFPQTRGLSYLNEIAREHQALTDEEVHSIRTLRKEGWKWQELADEFDVSFSTIRNVLFHRGPYVT